MGFVDVEHLNKFCFRKLGTRLKVGQMIRTIWVTWVTFDGSSGSHSQTKLSGCDPDF